MDFQQAVLDKSFERPVVVDFWAPWCGPCRVLGPTIEKLAEEQADKWDLVKVNTEDNPEIAQQYKIMSIPNVKLFHHGEVVAEFTGAQPRNMIERWLAEHIPDERKADLQSLIENAGTPEGLAQLEAFVAENPDIQEAVVGLAKHLVFQNTQRAVELVAHVKAADELAEVAQDIRTIGELKEFDGIEGPASAALATAKTALNQADQTLAIQQLIEATQLDKALANDLPRRASIALFRLLGPAHPVTKEYRWRFDMALY